jgi:hypothetical protein
MVRRTAIETLRRAEVPILNELSTALSRGEHLLSVIVPRSVEVVEAMVAALAKVGGCT